MLFVLIGAMLIASVCVLCLRKNHESLFLLGMCFSLMVQFSGILIFIAKKGGYTRWTVPQIADNRKKRPPVVE